MRHGSLPKCGGDSTISAKLSFTAPAALCGKQAGGLLKVDIPPMPAAQAAFPSGPLTGIHEIFDQLISHGRLATSEP
jgi:hypothetical protein